MPGSSHGIPDWAPTLADLLKNHGYATGQFGKNHLGDQDQHLPSNHGFDEFFGNLYHLNAEEEPETYHYPKDPEFREKYGPRGVIHSYADGRIEDTGPMTRKRMETADQEFLDAGLSFIDRAINQDKPFFVWMNTTRMHVWTRLKASAEGRTGIGIYPDGMVEHDDHVGLLLKKLDDLGISENTIVIYSTDNGAETVSWPDGGTTRFHGEKGTTWEGGMRVPCLVRWPGTIKGGTIFNDIMSQEDWIPTLMAAVGESDIVEKLKQGHEANGKKFRVHLDGSNFLPYFKGDVDKGPRSQIFYFGQGGELNAVRWNDWKVHFATLEGNIVNAWRKIPAWPVVINLRADPYEKAPHESEMYMRWMADNMWLFVPVQQQIQNFLGTIADYPFQEGQSLNAGDINYRSLKAMQILQQIREKGLIELPRN
jgi:arylsulfatase